MPVLHACLIVRLSLPRARRSGGEGRLAALVRDLLWLSVPRVPLAQVAEVAGVDEEIVASHARSLGMVGERFTQRQAELLLVSIDTNPEWVA